MLTDQSGPCVTVLAGVGFHPNTWAERKDSSPVEIGVVIMEKRNECWANKKIATVILSLQYQEYINLSIFGIKESSKHHITNIICLIMLPFL